MSEEPSKTLVASCMLQSGEASAVGLLPINFGMLPVGDMLMRKRGRGFKPNWQTLNVVRPASLPTQTRLNSKLEAGFSRVVQFCTKHIHFHVEKRNASWTQAMSKYN
jgi:hypothetical protein